MTTDQPLSTIHDEAALEDAVLSANVPTLLMVLVQLSGDLSWLEEPYVLSRTKGMADNDTGGLPIDLQVTVRIAALAAIRAWRDGAPVALPDPSPDLAVRMLGVSMGETVPREYGEEFVTELAAISAPAAPTSGFVRPTGRTAAVVGAGISGIAAAIRLARLGIACTVYEKSDHVGGVWWDNTYPGAGVDTPSHLYSYSFAPNDWKRYFASRDEIHEYVERVAREFGVMERIRFRTDVVRATWDDQRHRWDLVLRDEEGDRLESVDLVLSCVGAYNPPAIPAIPGLADFEGPCFHTARWPADLDLTGKRVAVLGSGATAMQVVPAIAPVVEELVILQRSPQWVQPFAKFQQPVPDAVRMLFRDVPLFRAWYRLRLSWIFHDKLYSALQRHDDWAGNDLAINAVNDGHRQYFTDYIREELGDRTDLMDRAVPRYPPFGKRMLQDNGWFRTLTRSNVQLVTGAVTEVTARAVHTTEGTHEVDVLVLATGFEVVRFLSSFEVVGKDGRTLREVWDDDDCRAYLGLSVPGFPNFFTLYGPNTQTGHGGSLIHTVESQLDYLMDLLQQSLDEDLASVECRPDVYERYGKEIDALHDRMIWTHPAMSTYYRNARGRVVAINPFRNVDFWQMTRHADLDDYDVRHASADLTPTS